MSHAGETRGTWNQTEYCHDSCLNEPAAQKTVPENGREKDAVGDPAELIMKNIQDNSSKAASFPTDINTLLFKPLLHLFLQACKPSRTRLCKGIYFQRAGFSSQLVRTFSSSKPKKVEEMYSQHAFYFWCADRIKNLAYVNKKRMFHLVKVLEGIHSLPMQWRFWKPLFLFHNLYHPQVKSTQRHCSQPAKCHPLLPATGAQNSTLWRRIAILAMLVTLLQGCVEHLLHHFVGLHIHHMFWAVPRSCGPP